LSGILKNYPFFKIELPSKVITSNITLQLDLKKNEIKKVDIEESLQKMKNV